MGVSRKDFLTLVIGSGAALAAADAISDEKSEARKKFAYEPQVSHDVPPRNRNPYAGLDWAACRQITTTSHGHCDNQKMLDEYVRHGYGFLTISNYYPSAPRYPGKDITRYHYHFHSDYPLTVRGRRKDGPFDWNKIIGPWKDEIKPEFRKDIPFDPGKDEKLFPNWPENMLEAPNAEHHTFITSDGQTMSNLHINAVGSFFKSGTIDKWNRYLTRSKAGFCTGSGENWRTAIDRMIKEMMFADGGGVTINHPTWSNLDREFMLKMLDHDPRVLGCEVMEAGTNSENYWDWILSTGRQCFGFFVPDHSIFKKDCGANILLVPEPTVHACLKAYRQGNFYGSLHALGELRFTDVSFDGKVVRASTDKPAKIQVITSRGVIKETLDKSVEWKVPVGKWEKNGAGVHVFARIKAFATDGSEEIIWSQPFLLR